MPEFEFSVPGQPNKSEEDIHAPAIMEGKYIDGESGTEEERQQCAQFYKLPSDATWKDIWEAVWEADRVNLAERYGLPEDANWDDIHTMISDEHVVRGDLDDIFGIPKNATPEERLKWAERLRPRNDQSEE